VGGGGGVGRGNSFKSEAVPRDLDLLCVNKEDCCGGCFSSMIVSVNLTGIIVAVVVSDVVKGGLQLLPVVS
jgi:hypothetical protein